MIQIIEQISGSIEIPDLEALELRIKTLWIIEDLDFNNP
jgi:hypothetical protein